MKKHKKIIAGLAFLAFFSFLCLQIFLPLKAAAATRNEAINCVDSLRFVNIAVINCKPSNSKNLFFVDINPTDNTFEYVVTENFFCGDRQKHIIELDLAHDVTGRTSGNLKIQDAGKAINAKVVRVPYSDSTNNCVSAGAKDVPVKNTAAVVNFLRFTNSGSNIESLTGVINGALAKQNYKLLEGSPKVGYYFVSNDINVSGDNCSGSLIALSLGNKQFSSTETKAIGIKYNLKNGNDAGILIDFLRRNGNTGGCGIGSTGFGLGDEHGFGIVGNPPSTSKTGSIAGTAVGVTSKETCESSSSIGLEWIICPVLRGIDKVVNEFYGAIEKQLCFKTGPTSSTGNVVCEGNPLLENTKNNGVKKTWTVFKNLATALLIITMLIMVVSQAIGTGPFETYTVRKYLPRLVAAVILIQLSWEATKWAVDLSNDVGVGISNLMQAPFGKDVFNIDKALGTIGGEGVLVTTGLFAGLAVVTAFSGLTVFGLGIMALSGLAALFVGFLVLIFRKILIIMSVILAPIAIIAWAMPGTERFWRLWRDNMLKLLAMFPLIVMLIASGRIFGSVAGSSTDGAVALLVVLVGFFGPLFVLPKTYQWGGQALGAIGGAMVSSTKSLRRKPMEYALGGAKENRQRRGQLRAERLADNPNNRRFLDRVLAGEFNYAKQRGRGGRLGAREMSFSQTLAEGEKAARENVPAQLQRVGYDGWRHGPAVNERGERIREGEAGYEINKLDALQAWLEGRTYAGVSPSEALSGHAFDTLATLGDPDRLREARESGHVDEQVWSKAIARNFPKVNEIARYLTLAPDLSNLTGGQFITQDDDTAGELERQLRGRYIHNRETGGRVELTDAEHRDQLTRAATLARDAEDNAQIWDNLSQTKRAVLRSATALAREAGIEIPRRRGEQPPVPLEPDLPPPPEGRGHEEPEGEVRIDR